VPRLSTLKILVSAYACHPLATQGSFPGEAILGWNLVREAGRFHEIHVLTRGYNQEAIQEAIKKENLRSLHFHYISLPKPFKLLLKNFFGFRIYYLLWQIKAYAFSKTLRKKVCFEIFHHITFNNDWMPSFIGAFSDIPFIWGPMGGGQRVPASFMRSLSLKSRMLEYARLAGQSFWRRTVFRRMCVRNAAAILVCNGETETMLRRLTPRICFFPVNGISKAELSSIKPRADHGRAAFKVLSAGRLDPIKGVAFGIRAFGAFSRKHPNSQFEIIGSGPEEGALRRLADELGIEKKVLFCAWLSRHELLKKLAVADVFLFPSLRDGGGAVVVESMASGTPVLCLDTGGPGFHVRQEWGIKVPPTNPDSVVKDLSWALESLYLDPDRLERMRYAAKARAEEYYLWERLGEKLNKIYTDVIIMSSKDVQTK
jgi:glycosyltransferase involved in cell wall biosynthesis